MTRTPNTAPLTKKPIRLALTIVAVLAAGLDARPASANGRPFRRVLVCQGAGMVPGLMQGVYDAACDAGRPPDLIIGTCGSALSAAVIGSFPDRSQRNEFLVSADHHSMYLSATVRRPSACRVLCRLMKARCRSNCECLSDTSVFDTPIMEVPLRPKGSHHIIKPFPTGEAGPRIIIIAAEIDYCPACEPRNKEGGKFYRETYFTDAETAKFLQNRPSTMAAQFPDCKLKPVTQVKLGHYMGDAARAGISDPYYMNLAYIDGRYYATGAVDQHPIELARSLGDEVIISFFPRSDMFALSVLATFYGFNGHQRIQYVNEQWANHWIDFSDFNQKKREFAFDCNVVPSCSVICEGECCLSPIRLVTKVPATLCEFQEKINLQYCYGYMRTIEAFQQPTGSQAHIRYPEKGKRIRRKFPAPQSRQRPKSTTAN